MAEPVLNKEQLLANEKPSRAIVRLAIPATLALLAKAVYNIVDTAYIGMLHDDNALAAVGVTLPLLLIMVSVCARNGLYSVSTNRKVADESPCPKATA